MSDTEAVKGALRALALGEPRQSPERRRFDARTPDEVVVERAAAALSAVDDAAAFADDGGLTRLEAVVDRAVRRGDESLARRGRRTLARYERFQAAAEGDADPVHFRRGHGTPLSDAGQTGDR